jgi:geranylgeranylglycerol-phosphate geranylgeranyltransferase
VARHLLAAVSVVHPFPTLLNASLVTVLAVVAGAAGHTAVLLGGAMFGFQASIGALNDIVDAAADRRFQPQKPIPAGAISVRASAAIVVSAALVGLVISVSFGLHVLTLGVVGFASGVAYDVVMRRLGLGWLCFAVAFPTLIVWTWMAAAGSLPTGWIALLPMAALAGPAIHLSNALVDPDADIEAGVHTLATRMGPSRALRVLVGLQITVFGLGWISLLLVGEPRLVIVVAAATATAVAVVGIWLSSKATSRSRDLGWMIQAVALAGMAVVWAASVALA